jgi:hypothetical protein
MGMKAAVACLGGGLRDDASLNDHIKRRVVRSIECAERQDSSAIVFSSSFTLNKPPVLDSRGQICSEASAMARYAECCGYGGTYYCEQQSHDTIGSAYFLFSDFFSFLRPTHITVITSDFHLPRVQLIFDHLAKLFGHEQKIEFFGCNSDIGSGRVEKEKVFLEKYLNEWNIIENLNDFRKSFFKNHDNYSVNFSSSYQGDMALNSY